MLENFILFAACFILQEDTLPEVSCSHTGRIKFLDLFQNIFQGLRGEAGIFGNFFKGTDQIAVIINIFYDPFRDKSFMGIELGKTYLPSQVVPKVVSLADGILIIRQFPVVPRCIFFGG